MFGILRKKGGIYVWFFFLALVACDKLTALSWKSSSFYLDTYYLLQKNFINPQATDVNTLLSEQENYFALAAESTTSIQLANFLDWNIELASGEVRWDQDLNEDGSQEFSFNDQNFSEALRHDYLFIREFYFTIQVLDESWQTKLGRFHFNTGQGLILDNYLFGLDTTAHFASHLFAEVRGSLIDFENPFAEVAFGISGEEDDRLRLFVDFFTDRSSSLKEILLQRQPLITLNTLYFGEDSNFQELVTLLESATGEDASFENREEVFSYLDEAVNLTTRANLFWFGLEGDKSLGNMEISALLGGQAGSIDLTYDSYDQANATEIAQTKQATLLSYFGLLFANYFPATLEEIDFGARLLLLGGDDRFSQGIEDGKTSAFLSIYPYFPYTNFFFNGVSPGKKRSLGSLGIDYKGTLAPQLFFNLSLFEKWLSSIKSTYLWSLNPSQNGSTQLGLEINWENTFYLTDSWLLNWGIDVFNPGTFFAAKEPFAYQIMAGVSYVFDSPK